VPRQVTRQVNWSDKVKHQRHCEYGNRSREVLQTRTLIADIDRIVQILNSDIAAEENQAHIFDRSKAEYPIHARMLADRRDNLQGTIAALEKQLSDLPGSNAGLNRTSATA
jgi:hypothetical protein